MEGSTAALELPLIILVFPVLNLIQGGFKKVLKTLKFYFLRPADTQNSLLADLLVGRSVFLLCFSHLNGSVQQLRGREQRCFALISNMSEKKFKT